MWVLSKKLEQSSCATSVTEDIFATKDMFATKQWLRRAKVNADCHDALWRTLTSTDQHSHAVTHLVRSAASRRVDVNRSPSDCLSPWTASSSGGSIIARIVFQACRLSSSRTHAH